MRQPVYPVRMNHHSRQAEGLVAWFPVQNNPGELVDVVGGVRIPLTAGSRLIGTPSGQAIDCTAEGTGGTVLAPSYVLGLLPLSLVVTFVQATWPGHYSTYFGVSYDNAGGAPYFVYELTARPGASTPVLASGFNDGAGYTSLESTVAPAAGELHQLVVTLKTGAQRLYDNGVLIASGSLSLSTAIASATAQLEVGGYLGYGDGLRGSHSLILDARIYNRILDPSEI